MRDHGALRRVAGGLRAVSNPHMTSSEPTCCNGVVRHRRTRPWQQRVMEKGSCRSGGVYPLGTWANLLCICDAMDVVWPAIW